MQTKLRKIGNGYGVLLPKQLIETLRLSEGDVLTLTETDSGVQLSPFDADFSEQVETFCRTEARHRNSYRELAK
jgi:antitoxin MazE